MKTAVETIEPTKVKLTVEVTPADLKPSLDRAYREIAAQVQVPGFRKGHVPPRIIDQRVGRGYVIEQAVNAAVPGFYGQAVEENSLHPIGPPSVEVTQVPDPTDPEGILIFTVEVEVRPEITIPDLATVTIAVEAAEVSDVDVDERLEALRERFGTLKGVDRPARQGDFLSIDLKAAIDGDEIDSVAGVSYQIGSGTMLDGLDEALIDLSAGETTSFEAPLAGGDRAGQVGLVTVTVLNVKERELPDVDDAFVELASEFDTIGELRQDLRTKAEQDKRMNQAVGAQKALVDKLTELADFPVPPGLIAAEVERHLESEGRTQDAEHRLEVEAETTAGLKTQLLLDALAQSLEIKITQGELLDFLVRMSQQYGMEPAEFIRNAEQSGRIGQFVGEISRNKATVAALRRVAVVDPDGRTVDLTPVIGPEPAADAGEVSEADVARAVEAAMRADAAAAAEAPDAG